MEISVLICNILIHEYVKRTYNVHKIFIYNIGILKHKKHLHNFLVQVRNVFITFELKGFST